MRKFLLILIAIVVIAVGIYLSTQDQKAKNQTQNPTTTNDLSHVPKENELVANLRTAGLEQLAEEGTILHIHEHLDITINGKAVAVPAEIGIGTTFISPIHTHDSSGILHVESPVKKDFTLGQFFTEWGVKLDTNCIATNCVDQTHKLIVAVNGNPITDPQNHVLSAHEEIEVWYGNTTENPTFKKEYTFPQGL